MNKDNDTVRLRATCDENVKKVCPVTEDENVIPSLKSARSKGIIEEIVFRLQGRRTDGRKETTGIVVDDQTDR